MLRAPARHTVASRRRLGKGGSAAPARRLAPCVAEHSSVASERRFVVMFGARCERDEPPAATYLTLIRARHWNSN